MNSRERILTALRREKPDRPPWMEISFHPQVASSILGEEIESEGSGFFPMDDVKEYEIELSKWIRLAKKIDLDALALKLWGPNFAGEKGPGYSGGTIKTLKGWEKAIASVPDIDDHDCYRCAKVLIKQARKEGIASFLETHFGFENVLESIGFRDFCTALFRNVNLIEHMLDFYAEFYSKVILHFMKLEPDFIVIGDDLAYGHGPFISPRQWKDIFQPRFKKIAEEIKCPWVFHSDGNLLPIMESLLDLGMNAIHPIEPYGTMDIVEVK
ncbi:MAG: uroporphyrinogen decarboxylase family protein, partial [Candidatus Hodarchaeota archaeon]